MTLMPNLYNFTKPCGEGWPSLWHSAAGFQWLEIWYINFIKILIFLNINPNQFNSIGDDDDLAFLNISLWKQTFKRIVL